MDDYGFSSVLKVTMELAFKDSSCFSSNLRKISDADLRMVFTGFSSKNKETFSVVRDFETLDKKKNENYNKVIQCFVNCEISVEKKELCKYHLGRCDPLYQTPSHKNRGFNINGGIFVFLH